MSFLRRKKQPEEQPPPAAVAVHEEITAQDYALKLNFVAKSSDGQRLPADPRIATVGIWNSGLIQPECVATHQSARSAMMVTKVKRRPEPSPICR